MYPYVIPTASYHVPTTSAPHPRRARPILLAAPRTKLPLRCRHIPITSPRHPFKRPCTTLLLDYSGYLLGGIRGGAVHRRELPPGRKVLRFAHRRRPGGYRKGQPCAAYRGVGLRMGLAVVCWISQHRVQCKSGTPTQQPYQLTNPLTHLMNHRHIDPAVSNRPTDPTPPAEPSQRAGLLAHVRQG